MPYLEQTDLVTWSRQTTSSQWRLWATSQSPMCNRGSRFGNSVDPSFFREERNIELTEVLGAIGEAESHSHDFQVSDDTLYSQRRSADAWRGNSLRQSIGHVLDCENPGGHASRIVARKALRGSRIFICVDQWSKTMSHQKWCSDTMQ